MNMNLSRSAVFASALLLLTACSNIGEKRTQLASAGFRTIPATTPAQIAKLQSLKSGKVVPLTSKKGTVYVFADKANNALLVGTPSQYQQYRLLKLKEQKIDEKLLDSQVNADNADYMSWGEGMNWGWGSAADPL
jgi:hypothetical protein